MKPSNFFAMHDIGVFILKIYAIAFFVITGTILVSAWSYKKEGGLQNGTWKSIIQRADGQQIVFNFEVADSAGKKFIYILNAKERLRVDSVQVIGDSVFIQLPFFESAFRAKITPSGLQGNWLRQRGNKLQIMPFTALYNQQRFAVPQTPKYNITGRYTVAFEGVPTVDSVSVGEFTQQGSRVTGTFLNPGGDYRYLEGVVSGDTLKLSTFDGGHAFLFTALINPDNTLSGGRFYAGPVGIQNWHACKDAKATLPDGYGIAKLKTGQTKLNFAFKSTGGETVSINDARYKNKVVIVQLLGSWCPNCMDETQFLSSYYATNHQRGVEIIGLAYEYTTNYETSRKSLQAFQQRFGVQYPILVTGVTVLDSLKTEKTLPQLQSIEAFPTSIFIDKKGNVRKIFTGYSGPATGDHFTAFKEEFNDLVDGLLAEN
jgi:peroxiredoxin